MPALDPRLDRRARRAVEERAEGSEGLRDAHGLIGDGSNRTGLVKAEGKSLETVTKPLTSKAEPGPEPCSESSPTVS
jgi:hypothetical protein